MRTIHRFLIGAAAAVAACSADAGPVAGSVPPPDGAIEGSWGLDPTVVAAGTEFLMSLRDSAGVVSGTGTFAGEAGPQGALQLSGMVQNDSLHLLVVYLLDPRLGAAPPDTGRLAGVLTTADAIDAMLADGGITRSIHLVRLKIGDPPG
jgi:hypothetical protein